MRIKNSLTKVKKHATRGLFYLMRIFPLSRKRIVFESHKGQSYSCNPKYIYRYLLEKKLDYQCIWFVDNLNIQKMLKLKTCSQKLEDGTIWFRPIGIPQRFSGMHTCMKVK